MSYTLDDVGNRTELGYPSGHTVAQAFDPLDRPSQIGPGTAGVPTENAVSYGYRGPHLLATTGYANGITGTRQFDAARRRTAETKVTVGGSTVFQESFSWSPRSLKTAYSRGDLNGRGFAVAYDGAKRVQQAAQHPAPTTLATNNSSLAPDALTDIPEAFSYQYDAAQNLISQTNKEDDIPVVEATPPDASGRNRPASLNGISLTWDANGNLVQRGDLALEYDFRNRLTRVSQGGVEIAQYEYDAFNRRVTKQVAGTTETTAWSGWRPIEEYRAGQIRQRRTYGLGLDEIVRLETDLDSNGVLDSAQVPLYDDTGNVAVVTDGSGKPVERYEYTPFGEKTILVDSTAPAVEQVRWVNGALVLEISEAVSGDALSRALTAGTLTLEKTATLETLELTVDQPVETEPQAHRRIVLALTDPTLVTSTDEVRLTIPGEALEDSFLNRPSLPFEFTFPWPSADVVLHDTAAPEVLEVLLYDGVLQLELSEPVDLATANASIGVGTPSLTWTASADGYTLSSVETLTDGDYTLSIGTGLQDLAGTALTAALSLDLTVTTTVPKQRLFEAPNPQETTASTIGNAFGFHGLPQDAETGLVYVRNRYYDPELGRFISADPLGYVDGPSMYQFALNSPVNFVDPFGTQSKEAASSFERMEHAAWLSSPKVQAALKEQQAELPKVEGGFGEVKIDEYFILVNKMPPAVTPEEFLNELLEAPNPTVDDPIFDLMNEFDRRTNGGNPEVGDVYDIDILGPDNGAVMLVEKTDSYFVFQTVTTPQTGSHPEQGSREFGFEKLENGTIRLYTRGYSRPRDPGVAVFGPAPQNVAWIRLLRGLSDEISRRGGEPVPMSIEVFKGNKVDE